MLCIFFLVMPVMIGGFGNWFSAFIYRGARYGFSEGLNNSKFLTTALRR